MLCGDLFVELAPGHVSGTLEAVDGDGKIGDVGHGAVEGSNQNQERKDPLLCEQAPSRRNILR